VKIALTYNLRPEPPGAGQQVAEETCEFDTERTVGAMAAALAAEGHEIVLVEARPDAAARLAALRPDFAFNVAEGLRGADREAQIPALLELLGIAYTGPGPWCAATTLDKRRTKEVLAQHGIPTPAYAYAGRPADLRGWRRFPAIVKPVGEGSSKGIWQSNVVTNAAALRRRTSELIEGYRQGVMVEEFIDGREFTAGMLGNDPRVILPLAEVVFPTLPPGTWPIDSFEAKWVWNGQGPWRAPRLECPAHVSSRLRRRIASSAAAAFASLDCRDLARLDLRVSADGTPYVLEVNALPGLIADVSEESRFPYMARRIGLDYPDLVRTILHTAMQRHGLPVPAGNGVLARARTAVRSRPAGAGALPAQVALGAGTSV